MKREKSLLILSVFLLLLLISMTACSPQAAEPTEMENEVVQAEETVIEEEEVEVEAEPEPEPTAAPVETEEEETTEEETVADAPAEMGECLVCHSDKQMLIDTADEVEEHVEENEGAG